MGPVTEQQIKDFVTQLREDLVTAEKFLAMWKRRNQVEPLVESPAQLSLNGDAPPRQQTTAAIVREAIMRCPAQFTLDDVESALTAMRRTDITRGAAQRAIQRLLVAKRPILKTVEKGMGRLPAKYAVMKRE